MSKFGSLLYYENTSYQYASYKAGMALQQRAELSVRGTCPSAPFKSKTIRDKNSRLAMSRLFFNSVCLRYIAVICLILSVIHLRGVWRNGSNFAA